MHTRLLEIMNYKTGGRQTEFADFLGWKPQYLAKLLKGENFGLQPVLSVVARLPEINARWLLTGEGDMIENKKYTEIRKKMYENVIKVLDMEKYMPVMSPAELRLFERVIIGKEKADFSPESVYILDCLLKLREDILAATFKAEGRKSNELCNQRKVKK
jgi:hypothetical protein